ncbi:MAG: hypothetical protein A2275_10665 [Bacteroidetes bacterium RIFOXYA12_FULL_35_11]|nr:MAG: hypothetical protein A2X01_03885 [Bacteroidetes bacterium GWF2_35_48]OFY73360.1 MAG: hypothetical protein A2275_10665 [Bacteroidetes bacterium RIFOXYA12_FULL_35_11]OFZ06259.1 MAG: hypothetical protein A2491_11945 [Bacteroidetes bacterium RIFOXYC12_FULL_35_7]
MEGIKKKYFWLFQLSGWGLIGVLNLIVQNLNKVSSVLITFNVLGLSIGGFLISTCFRFYLKKRNWLIWNKRKLMLFIFISVTTLSIIWLLLLYVVFGLLFSDDLPLVKFMTNIIPIGMMMMIWCLFYFGYHLIMHYHLSEVEKWKLKSEIQKAQLDILKLQINPHFLFNTLNNIRALILEDKNRARQMITNFSDLFRYSLQYTDKREVFLSDELDIVNQFLELVKIQYEEKLEYKITIEDGLEREYIPPMLIQILVENAIKHGIALSVKKENCIFIDIRKSENNLLIKIKNTGTLDDKNKLETSHGLGLKNIKERLQFLYGKDAIFNLKSEQGFVEATIQITK